MKVAKLFYKNVSDTVKTFYNVTFNPGETKSVPGYINSLYMIRCDEPVKKAEPVQRVVNKEPNKPEVANKKTSEIKNEEET